MSSFFVPKLTEKHAVRGVYPDKHSYTLYISYYFNAGGLCPKLDKLHTLCDTERCLPGSSIPVLSTAVLSTPILSTAVLSTQFFKSKFISSLI